MGDVGVMGVSDMERRWLQGGPGKVGEAIDMEALAVEEEVSMECNEVQEEDSDSYCNQTDVCLILSFNTTVCQGFCHDLGCLYLLKMRVYRVRGCHAFTL